MARAHFSRTERIVSALIVISLALSRRACPQARYVNADTVLVMPTLQSLADTATREYGRCLLGAFLVDASGDTIYFIDGAMQPMAQNRPADRPNTGITFACYLSEQLIGTWHNHVLAEWQKLKPGPWSWPDAPTPAAQACQLSGTDFLSATKPLAPPISAISVDKHTFCWWFKSDLLAKYGAGDVPQAVRPDSLHLRTDWPEP